MSRELVELRVVKPAPPADLVPCLECGKCCTYVAVGIIARKYLAEGLSPRRRATAPATPTSATRHAPEGEGDAA